MQAAVLGSASPAGPLNGWGGTDAHRFGKTAQNRLGVLKLRLLEHRAESARRGMADQPPFLGQSPTPALGLAGLIEADRDPAGSAFGHVD